MGAHGYKAGWRGICRGRMGLVSTVWVWVRVWLKHGCTWMLGRVEGYLQRQGGASRHGTGMGTGMVEAWVHIGYQAWQRGICSRGRVGLKWVRYGYGYGSD